RQRGETGCGRPGSVDCTWCSARSLPGGTVARQGAARKTEAAERDVARERSAAGVRTAGLDRLIHERVRLGIVSALAVNDSLSFNQLKALLKTTDGNLSVHARKLE